ncbi:MAG: CPBP family intramembrane metalloprotease [Muribaculaceae bacterium]|nr:CPBP family intramembrane metalloprotease [Muribaculaceae bacterium]
MNQFKLRFDYLQRILIFLIISLICLIIAGIIMGIVLGAGDGANVRLMRIATVVQDVIGFILPSFATAVVISQLPASFLGVDKCFSLPQLVMAVGVMIASTPFMNLIIDWNSSITLPGWASGIEQAMRQAEDRAASSVGLMLSGDSTGATLVTLLIVGVLAGFSEELFFRGTLQRLLSSGRMSIHTSIWLGAVIFSIFHFQFYGFFPRVLLGAFFGYLLYWSGSIWLPVIIHAFNNSIYVLSTKHGVNEVVNQFGIGDTWLIVGSIIVTAVIIMWLSKSRHNVKVY